MQQNRQYAVLGATGQTGGAVARHLLSKNQHVCAIGRSEEHRASWQAAGAIYRKADLKDEAALTAAFAGCDTAYIMSPPNYRDADIFQDAQKNCRVLKQAIQRAKLKRVVVLSSVGAHLEQGTGNIATVRELEQTMRELPIEVSVVRAAWFMENWLGVAPTAKKEGVLPSLLQPVDKLFPMVSAEDIGRVAAEQMLAEKPHACIELQGPLPVSAQSAAKDFAQALQRDVAAVVVPDADLTNTFLQMQMPPAVAAAWAEMVRGFNSGHIVFAGGTCHGMRGVVTMADVAVKWAKKIAQAA